MEIQMFKSLMLSLKNSFPGHIRKTFILNPSFSISMAFKACSAFIDMRKVTMVDKKEFHHLHEFISRDQLQMKYGGSAQDVTQFFPPFDTFPSVEKVTLEILAKEKMVQPFFFSVKKHNEFLRMIGAPTPTRSDWAQSDDEYLKLSLNGEEYQTSAHESQASFKSNEYSQMEMRRHQVPNWEFGSMNYNENERSIHKERAQRRTNEVSFGHGQDQSHWRMSQTPDYKQNTFSVKPVIRKKVPFTQFFFASEYEEMEAVPFPEKSFKETGSMQKEAQMSHKPTSFSSSMSPFRGDVSPFQNYSYASQRPKYTRENQPLFENFRRTRIPLGTNSIRSSIDPFSRPPFSEKESQSPYKIRDPAIHPEFQNELSSPMRNPQEFPEVDRNSSSSRGYPNGRSLPAKNERNFEERKDCSGEAIQENKMHFRQSHVRNGGADHPSSQMSKGTGRNFNEWPSYQ